MNNYLIKKIIIIKIVIKNLKKINLAIIKIKANLKFKENAKGG